MKSKLRQRREQRREAILQKHSDMVDKLAKLAKMEFEANMPQKGDGYRLVRSGELICSTHKAVAIAHSDSILDKEAAKSSLAGAVNYLAFYAEQLELNDFIEPVLDICEVCSCVYDPIEVDQYYTDIDTCGLCSDQAREEEKGEES